MSYSEAEIISALSFVASDEREIWVRVGMSVKAALGDAGWPIWRDWSRQSPSFREADARAVWRGFRTGGGIGPGTLFHLARQAGWTPVEQPGKRTSTREEREAHQRRREAERRATAAREREQAQAAETAQKLLKRATFEAHPYLGSKGFVPLEAEYGTERSRAEGYVLDGELLIPMRDMKTDEVLAVQKIDRYGRKRFHPKGARASGAVFRLGCRICPRLTWWCEGYATALSLMEALDGLHRAKTDQVVVCFSSGNLGKIARHGIVIADHDFWRCKNKHEWKGPSPICPTCTAMGTMPAGERAARKTHLPWWMPPDVDTDANDYHNKKGIDELKRVMLSLIVRARSGRFGKTYGRAVGL